MSLFRTVTGLLFTSGFLMVVNAVTGIALARLLSVDDRGLYSVATAFAGMAATLAVFGWPSATIFQIRRLRLPARDVVASGMVVQLGLALLVIAVGIAFEPDLRLRFLESAPSDVYDLALAVVPALLLAQGLSAAARAIDRFNIQNTYRGALVVIQLVGFLVVLGPLHGGLLELMWTWLGINVVLTLGLAAAVVRHTGLSARVNWGQLRAGLAFGAKSYVQSLSGQIHERIDIFMLAAMLQDPSQVAFYTVAAGLSRLLYTFSDAMTSASYPSLAALDRDRAAAFAARVCRQSFALVLGCVVVMGLAGPVVVPLFYGSPYAASVMPFLLLLPGMALVTLYRVLAVYFTSIERQQSNIAIQIFSATVNIGLNWLLIPRWGINGAALASLFSYSLEAVLITVTFVVHSGLGVREVVVLRRSDIVALRDRIEKMVRRARYLPGNRP